MERKRIQLIVSVDLDPIPGSMHTKESARNIVAFALRNAVGSYNPIVSIPEENVTVKLVDDSDEIKG